ncbi:MAG: thiamine phosphate synthase [Gemmatimonadota bacterium]
MRENLADVLRLLLVTDDAVLAGRDPMPLCEAAVAGGVTAVQLRLKAVDDRTLAGLARRMLAALPVPIFLNDRLDVALAVGAAGVHLGADDLAPALARRLVPPGFVIGASVGSVDEVARGEAADYWGVGPLHGSSTKHDAGAALGWDGARSLAVLSGARPCVVIGGVRPEDVAIASEAGFAGVAVVSGILMAEDIAAAARGYLGEGRREKGEE